MNQSKQFITYHGTDDKNLPSLFANSFDSNLKSGYGKTFGFGVYTTPNIKYASMYSDTNKVLICKIETNKYIKISKTNAKQKNKEYKEILKNYDLIIIEDETNPDCPEYLCPNPLNVSIIGLLIVEKKIEDNLLLETNILETRILGSLESLESFPIEWTKENISIL